MTAYKS